MAKRWTDKELKILLDARSRGVSYEDIPLDRTVASMKTKIRDLGVNKSTAKKWTEYEENLLYSLKAQGFSIAYIAAQLERSEASMYKKLSQKKKDPIKFTDDYLLNLVRKYKTQDNLNYNRIDEEPSSGPIIRRFGSWGEALIIAGMEPNRGSFDPLVKTILYLVKFGQVRKVGITQRSVAERLRGFPEYEILDQVELSYPQAKELEKDILSLMKPYKIYGNLPNGNEECFIYNIDKLEDFF